MPTQFTHPKSFSTNVEPTLDVNDSRVQYSFNSLLGRKGRTFFFVDHLFEKRPSGLHGAVGTRMSPVHRDFAERQKKKYLDEEQSPLKYIYEEMDTSQEWDRWIKTQFDREGLGVIYDDSYRHKYGEVVKEKTAEEGIHDKEEIVFVNCIGGGRMFNAIETDWDSLFDEELLKLAIEAEEHGLEGI